MEFLRVAINISWAGFALSLGLAIFWGMFAGPLKSWVDGMFPLLLVGYACWKLYFIRRATRIVAHNDAMKTKSRRK